MFSLSAYDVLGVSEAATQEEIELAFHKQMSAAASMANPTIKQKYIDDLTKAYETLSCFPEGNLSVPPLPGDVQVYDEDIKPPRLGWGILQSNLPIWAKVGLVLLRIILAIVCLPLLLILLFLRICGTIAAFVIGGLIGLLGLLIVLMVFLNLFKWGGIQTHWPISQYIGMSIFGGLCFVAATVIGFAPAIIDLISVFLTKYVYGIDLL